MRISDVEEKAKVVRREILGMLKAAGSGHTAGPMGAAEILTALYFGGVLNHDPKNPWWEERDRFVLSVGHYAPLLYATLAEAGYFSKDNLKNFMKLGSPLQGHPLRLAGFERGDKQLPGVENTGGPLGQGVSVAVGMALALKLKRSRAKVYCLMSDGEMEEGQTWEAVMFAAKRKLNNLVFIVDRNNIQIDAYVSDVMSIEPVVGKLEAFGLQVYEVEGNEMSEVIRVMEKTRAMHREPVVVIARTTAGKGVTIMENDPEWHDKIPSQEEYDLAMEELR